MNLEKLNLQTMLPTERFQTCLATNEGLTNSTSFIDIPTPHPVEAALQVFPGQFIDFAYYTYATITGIIGSNVIEAYMYITIFQNIKRFVEIIK